MRKRVLGLALLAFALVQEGGPAYAQCSVQADRGSLGLCGNISDSTITVGVPPDQLEALVRDRVRAETRLLEKYSASLERELNLNQRQVQTALDILGEANVPLEQLPVKIVEVAQRFKALQTAATAQPDDDPTVTALKAEAQKAIEAGDLAKADELLAKVEQVQAATLDRLALNTAETSAQRGEW